MQAKLMEPFQAAKVEQVGFDMKVLVSGGGFMDRLKLSG